MTPRAAPALLGLAAFAVVAGLAFVGCRDDKSKPAAPAAAPAAPAAQPAAAPAARARTGPLPVFVDVAKEAGLTAMNHSGKPLQKDWIVSGMGGGAIVFDYDRDGWMDLVVVDGTMLTEDGELQYDDDWRTRVYHNDGGMHFTDVTRKCGVDLKAFGFGGASCDYDADGWPDFYVCCWGRSYLYHNRGDGTFEEVAAKAGVTGLDDDMATACAWGDVNGDGVPDLYVSTYCDQRAFIKECLATGRPGRSVLWRNFHVYAGPMGLPAQRDHLYFGKGDGTFRDVTETNLPQPKDIKDLRYGFQCVMTDVDNDGDLDIYVANDTQANYLWVNDGKGKFVDRGMEAGCAMDFDSQPQASMGVDAADVDHDGWVDVVVTNFSHNHLTVYENQTKKTRVVSFTDMSNRYGVTRPSFLRLQWGTRFFDYDNDGDLDLFVACGHVYGEIDHFEAETGSGYKQRCLLLHNVGAPSYGFENVTDPADDGKPGVAGPAFDVKRVWRGAAFADFDNDGDMDVFVSALNDYPALFRNDGGDRGNFLVFRLIGKGTLRDPSGARVSLFLDDGRPHMEELHHGASFCGDNDPRLFFGVGQATAAKRVEIKWPNGEKQSFADVAARKFYVVEQGKDELSEDKR